MEMSRTVDDKSQLCIPFILERLEAHRRRYTDVINAPPLFLGLSGVQGAGKTVLLGSCAYEGQHDPLAYRVCRKHFIRFASSQSFPDFSAQVSIIRNTLERNPYNLPTVVFSLDDLYLTHAEQVSLASQHPDNPLLQHRGQPSTHDIHLARSLFSSLRQNSPTRIPKYNKSAFHGRGDRVSEADWQEVNVAGQSIARVVLFEGWAVGFRPLSEHDLKQKWEHAVMARKAGRYLGRLGYSTLESVAHINSALREYEQITDQLDAIIHIDAYDPQYVYKWRLDQEADLRASKGSGMTDDEVRNFVDGYYPAYELYTGNLRSGVFGAGEGRQLRLIVDEDRRVMEAIII